MKRSIMSLLALFVFMYSVAAFAQEEGNSRAYNSGYSSAWKATIQSLNEGGDTIVNQDKETGTIKYGLVCSARISSLDAGVEG